jgi:alpha-1,6-mannosyltransferase
MRALVRELAPDVLQISSPFLPALAARGLRGEVGASVYVYHSDPIGCYLRPTFRALLPAAAGALEDAAWCWMRAVCRSCDATVVSGAWLQRMLLARSCGRVEVVPFGIAHGDLGPERADAGLRRALLGPLARRPGAALLLVAGRLAIDKRQRLLVEAIAELASRHPLALVVLGDGPERAALEEQARRLDQVTFLPFTRDRAHYATILASVDALVHGSLGETFGFVIAEALASGTPVVVPDEGGAPELVDSSCAAIYPACADASAIACALEDLLARPRAALRNAARTAAQRQPHGDQHFDELFALYASMLKDRADPRAARRAPATWAAARSAAQ